MLPDLPTLVSTYLPVLALSVARTYGVWTLLPLLGPQSLGGGFIRNSLILALSVPIMYAQAASGRLESLTLVGLFICVVKEMVIGLLIGFSVTIPFWALDIASFIIDTLRGSSMATVLNPLLSAQSSIFGLFFSQLIAVLFFSFGGLHALIATIYDSYSILPMGASFSVDTPWISLISREWSTLLRLGLSFAMPSMIMMILIDIALGLMNRSAQQLNVFFLAMPIKSVMILLLMVISLEFSLELYSSRMLGFAREFLGFLENIA